MVVTLCFGHARQRQLCSRWTRIFCYGMCTAAGRGLVPRGLAGGWFASVIFLLELVDASKKVCSLALDSPGTHVRACAD